MSWGVANAEKTKNQCEADCAKNQSANETACKSELASAGSSDNSPANFIRLCKQDKLNECKATCSDLPSAQDARSECKDAKKAYDDATAKGREACAAFTSEKEKAGKEQSCTEKVAACRGAVTGLFESSDDEEESTGAFEILGGILKRTVLGQSDPTTPASSAEACVDEPDQAKREQAIKEQKAEEKDFRREKKDIEDRIKKEADEQAKLREKEREKQDDIKKKTSEIEADNKKENLKREKSMREQVAQLSKSSVDTAKRIRAFNIAITAERQKMDQERFNLNTAMLELTDEKTTLKCRQQFEALKVAIVDAKPVTASSTEEQKQQEALAAQFRGKGIKGTAQLKQLLNLTKKACFEAAQTKINQINLTSSQKMQSSADRINELQNSINDENKHVQLDQENIKKIQAETDKEKTTEESEMLKKTSNLNEELLNFSKSTEEKTKISTAQQEKLRKDIEDLVVEHNKPRGIPKSLTNFRKAEGLIRTREDKRSDAVAACCTDKPAADQKKNGCERLMKEDKVDLSKRAKKPEESTN